MWRVGIEPTTSLMDDRVRRKIKEKINVESGHPQPLGYARKLRDKFKEK